MDCVQVARRAMQARRWINVALAVLTFGTAAACKGYGSGGASYPPATVTGQQATIGAAGGVITGAAGTALDGVKVVFPPGALAGDTVIQIKPAVLDTPLPGTALRVGPQIEIDPAGMRLAIPAQVTLPFDESAVAGNDRSDDEVAAVTVTSGQQKKQVDSGPGSVTFDLSTLDVVAASVTPPGPSDRVQFDLHVNPKSLACIAQFPGDAARPPSVTATVVRGSFNDTLSLRGHNLKPGVKFELFTVERSNLKTDGTVDATVPNFGFAWYQSEIEINDEGGLRADLRTILLDEIFGFDPAAGVPPTNAFHLGFWFNDPQDAAACGFNTAAPTPFNGEHKAGPLAMISVPDGASNLGPLCSHPDTSTAPARCAIP